MICEEGELLFNEVGGLGMDGVVSTKSHCGAQCGGSAITILAVPNSAPNETRVLTASG